MAPVRQKYSGNTYRSAFHKMNMGLIINSLILLPLFIFYSFKSISGEEIIAEPDNNPLVICLPDDVVTMDPAMHRSRITQIVLKNIFDSLTARDEKNNVVPQLAESWRLISDTEWEFRLRDKVRFHNGERLTAYDVKFTLERVINEDIYTHEISPRKGLFEPVIEVTAPDELTIRIKTGHPWPILPLMLSLQEIIPESYFKKVGSNGFNDFPVGAGPFKFVRGKRGDEIVLERFEDYYGGSSLRPPVQKAPLRQVVFKIAPSSLDQLAMLKSGKCDILFDVSPEYITALGMASGIRILKIPATKSYFAEINCTRPPMNDIRVRRALNYAVDINTIIKHKLSGQGHILATVVLPNAFGFNSRLEPYPYNTTMARELLNEAEYPYDYVISIFANRNDLILADSISLYLTKMGLKVQLKIVPYFRPQDTGADAPWDIFVGSWGNSTLDPADILIPKLRSSGSANYSGFSSAELDMMMDKVQQTMDKTSRIDHYQKIQEIIFNEAPMIFGYAPVEYYAVSEKVKNFNPSSSGMIDLHDVYKGGNR